MTYIVRSVLKDLSLLYKSLPFDISTVDSEHRPDPNIVLSWIALSYNAVVPFLKLRHELRKTIHNIDFALSFAIVDEHTE